MGARVVKELMAHWHGKKHHVFFDNFFTSKELLEDLEKNGIYQKCRAYTVPHEVSKLVLFYV